MENKNVIESVTHTRCSKRELLDIIERNFPDDEVGTICQIAEITTTEMTDGTKMQSICFGKILNL